MTMRPLRTATAALVLGTLAALAPPQAPAAADLRLIVQGEADGIDAAAAAVLAAGGHVDRRLGIIDAVSATVPARALPGLKKSAGVRSVSLNGPVSLRSRAYTAEGDPKSLFNNSVALGVRDMWQQGFTGKGIDVALIDSGVAPVEGIRQAGLVYGPDLTPESQNPATANLDTYGHGTHMAGIIAGRDAVVTDVTKAAKDSRNFLGVAPDARIVSVKAADYDGSSDVSQVIAGIDWVVQHAKDPGLNIRVLNLSYGTDSAQSYLTDPLTFAAEQAWKAGIVVVVSAGNSGDLSGRLTSPALDPFLLAVGAMDNNGTPNDLLDDWVPDFSAVGDVFRGTDVIAPGVSVPSLRVPGSRIDTLYGATANIGSRLTRGSGTSQAAAFASGEVALLLSARPTLSPDDVKALAMKFALGASGTTNRAKGRGTFNLLGALDWVLPKRTGQGFTPATGGGSLELSRGTTHLMFRNSLGLVIPLAGEVDIFGKPVDTVALAKKQAAKTSWTGGTWNGSSWAGNGWAGSTWASSAWAGSSWAGNSWAGSSWAGSTWANASWSSSGWAGSSWASSSWASSAWASSSWAGNSWAGKTWADASWS